MTRRRLLFAGGATLLAGCGKEEAASSPPPVTDVLKRSAEAETRLALSARVQEAENRPVMRRIAARAEQRAGQAAAALHTAGGQAGGFAAEHPVGEPMHNARVALEAHVAALPSLSTRDQRSLGVHLVKGCAADLAVLEATLASWPADPFPGTPQ